jgi:hypothetical protein
MLVETRAGGTLEERERPRVLAAESLAVLRVPSAHWLIRSQFQPILYLSTVLRDPYDHATKIIGRWTLQKSPEELWHGIKETRLLTCSADGAPAASAPSTPVLAQNLNVQSKLKLALPLQKSNTYV